MSRPEVAVSACLLGHPVRYDGRDKRLPMLETLFPGGVDYVPFCPEVAIGLGVPRRPIELRRCATGLRLVDREDGSLDHGPAMTAHARAWLADHPRLAGMILKSRSPSCGLGSAPIRGDGPPATGDGHFAARVRRLRPGLPLIDDAGLEDDAKRRAFVAAVLGGGWDRSGGQ